MPSSLPTFVSSLVSRASLPSCGLVLAFVATVLRPGWVQLGALGVFAAVYVVERFAGELRANPSSEIKELREKVTRLGNKLGVP